MVSSATSFDVVFAVVDVEHPEFETVAGINIGVDLIRGELWRST